MRRVGIRKFRKNLSKELKDLPFMITKRGNDVALAYKIDGKEDICKHGIMKKLCNRKCKNA